VKEGSIKNYKTILNLNGDSMKLMYSQFSMTDDHVSVETKTLASFSTIQMTMAIVRDEHELKTEKS
jgi:hypothetical protein